MTRRRDLRKVPKRTLGWGIIEWIEAYLCHGPGDIQGTPFSEVPLTDEQCRFLLWAYALRANGRRLIRRAFLSRPKGWAKSELAGAIAVAEGLGPVRFDGWGARKQPVGRPVTSPEILCVATEEGQAGNTYDNVVVMGTYLLENHGDEFGGLDVGLTRTFIPGGGEITPVTAKARSKDGGKSTHCVFDETHLYDNRELRELHAMIRRNLGKRAVAEPWSHETSTMYRPGAGSVAEATHDYAKKVAAGEIRDDSLLFDHRQAPEEFDWNDDDALREALRAGYGDADFLDLDRIIKEIRDPQVEEADSRRYWLNQVVQAAEQAINPARWAALADAKHVVADRSLVVLGFSGHRFRDATALVGTEVQSGHQFVVRVWERPPDAPADWEVPEGEVDEEVTAAFDRFDVWRLYGDPPYWESALDRWAGRWEKRVVRWWTSRNKPWAYALRAYLTAIRTGELSNDGNSAMARHMANAMKREVPNLRDEESRPLWVIAKEHDSSPKVINAAKAGCLAWEARGDAIAAGAKPKKGKRAVFL